MRNAMTCPSFHAHTPIQRAHSTLFFILSNTKQKLPSLPKIESKTKIADSTLQQTLSSQLDLPSRFPALVAAFADANHTAIPQFDFIF